MLDPGPVRAGGPPIMLGSNSPRMLSIGLPVVDAWNVWWSIYGNSVEGFAEVKARSTPRCRRAGRSTRPRACWSRCRWARAGPWVEAGELDLALVYDHQALPEIAARDLERTPLLDDVFRVVLPAGHRLARRSRALELADLGGELWIGGAPTSAWYRIVDHACRLARVAPEVRFASDDYIAVQALVAAGLGVAVVPGLAVTHPLPGLQVRAIRGAPVRQISAVRPRDGYHGPAVGSMLDSLRAAAETLTIAAQRHDAR